jgi:hypothetical protein
MGKKKDIDKEERKFKESFSNLGKLSKAAKIKCIIIVKYKSYRRRSYYQQETQGLV